MDDDEQAGGLGLPEVVLAEARGRREAYKTARDALTAELRGAPGNAVGSTQVTYVGGLARARRLVGRFYREALAAEEALVLGPTRLTHLLTVVYDEMGVAEYLLTCPWVASGCCSIAKHEGLVDAARRLDVPHSGGELVAGEYQVAVAVGLVGDRPGLSLELVRGE